MHNGMGRRQTTGLVIIATSFGFLLQLLFFILHLILSLHPIFLLNLGPDGLQCNHGLMVVQQQLYLNCLALHGCSRVLLPLTVA